MVQRRGVYLHFPLCELCTSAWVSTSLCPHLGLTSNVSWCFSSELHPAWADGKCSVRSKASWDLVKQLGYLPGTQNSNTAEEDGWSLPVSKRIPKQSFHDVSMEEARKRVQVCLLLTWFKFSNSAKMFNNVFEKFQTAVEQQNVLIKKGLNDLIINYSAYLETFSFKITYFSECNWHIHRTTGTPNAKCACICMFTSNYII